MTSLALYGKLCTILKTQSVLNNCDLILRFIKHRYAPTQAPTFCSTLSYTVLHLGMSSKLNWEIKVFFRIEGHAAPSNLILATIQSLGTQVRTVPNNLVLFLLYFLKRRKAVEVKRDECYHSEQILEPNE